MEYQKVQNEISEIPKFSWFPLTYPLYCGPRGQCMISFSLETQVTKFVSVKKKINNNNNYYYCNYNYNYNAELHFRQTDTEILFSWYLHQVYFILPSKPTLNF